MLNSPLPARLPVVTASFGPTTERPVSMKIPPQRDLPNDNVNTTECELDNKDDEHNTKVYESVEEMVDEASNNITNT